MSDGAPPPKPAAERERARGYASFGVSLAVAAIIVWAVAGSGAVFDQLGGAGPRLADFIDRLLPPDFSERVLSDIGRGLVETLQIAIIGTVLSVVLSAGLGLLAAATLTPAWVHLPMRALLAAVRGVPVILVAILMVAAVGLGPVAGTLAIAFHATGMLAKFYAEAIEGVDRAPVEALESSGAGLAQRLRFAVWPQVAPDVMRDTLFRFEMNLRESTILGVVGGGGIGHYLLLYADSLQYQRLATVTLAIIVLAVAIELFNALVRRMLR